MSNNNISSEITTIVSFNNETLFSYVENDTTVEHSYNDTDFIKYPIYDDGFLVSFMAIVAIIGIFGNGLVLCILLRQKLSGIYSLLFQLSCIDILKICFLTYPEVWSLNNGSWIFTSELCPVYLGVEVIAGTIVTYLIVLINLHIITIWNINIKNVKEILKDSNNPLTRSNCYDRLPNKKNSRVGLNRNASKYKGNKLSLSVLFPLIIIWTLAISLSIPMFGLSTTVVTKTSGTFCTIVDMQHYSTMQITLCIIRIIIPYLILCLTTINLIVKLFMRKYVHIVDNQNKKSINIKVKYYITFGILLTGFHLLLSTKSIFVIQHTISTTKDVSNVIDKLKMPPLQNLVSSPNVTLILSMIYYALTALRFSLYFILPIIRKLFGEVILRKEAQNKDEC